MALVVGKGKGVDEDMAREGDGKGDGGEVVGG